MAITESIVGVFAHVDTTVRALEELRAKGYHDLTVYTPVPVHEIEDVLERDRPVSRVRIFALLGGLIGLASAWILTAWTSVQWNLYVGGKPPIGLPVSPPYVVIMFELMVLFGGIATVIGMVVLGRLPRAPMRCAREVRLHPGSRVHRRRRGPDGRDHRLPMYERHDADTPHRRRRARVRHADGRRATGR